MAPRQVAEALPEDGAGSRRYARHFGFNAPFETQLQPALYANKRRHGCRCKTLVGATVGALGAGELQGGAFRRGRGFTTDAPAAQLSCKGY